MTDFEKRRCKAKGKQKGTRCGNWALPGLEVCRMHGGATKAAKRKSEEAKIVMQMQRFVQPIDRDDPETNPITAFETEFRRTLGRIRWYDEQLAQLDAEALTWGKTKEEEIGAGEDPGTNVTYEARANSLHELQFRERQHLTDMTKIYIGARLDERKLDIQRAYVKALDSALVGILSALGHDPGDPATRQVVRDHLLALPMRG